MFPEKALEKHQELLLAELDRNGVALFVKLLVPSMIKRYNKIDAKAFHCWHSFFFGDASLVECFRGPVARYEVWEETKKTWDAFVLLVDKVKMDCGVDLSDGPFTFGATPYYVEIYITAFLIFTKRILCDRDEGLQSFWEVIWGWNEGRWEVWVNSLEEYTTIYN